MGRQVRGADLIRVHSADGFGKPTFGLYPEIGARIEQGSRGGRYTVVETARGVATTVDIHLARPIGDSSVVYVGWDQARGWELLTYRAQQE